jgi:LmbE family N-acetylglucosaminyl deacetylase
MKVSIISAHPDDEVLGCGGTILKHKHAKDEISFLWLTNGIGARQVSSKEEVDRRANGHQKAIEYINPFYSQFEDFLDNQLDTVPLLELVKTTEEFIKKTKPDIIYTHFINDLNIDHALTCRAVLTATRPGSKSFVKEIYSFEVASSTEWAPGSEKFIPDTYVDISHFMEQKRQYLECYKDEMREMPHPRAIENIIVRNQVRGSEMSLKYAEAFITLRKVIE